MRGQVISKSQALKCTRCNGTSGKYPIGEVQKEDGKNPPPHACRKKGKLECECAEVKSKVKPEKMSFFKQIFRRELKSGFLGKLFSEVWRRCSRKTGPSKPLLKYGISRSETRKKGSKNFFRSYASFTSAPPLLASWSHSLTDKRKKHTFSTARHEA